MSALRPVKGWIPPKRWPTREEFAAHQYRMRGALAASAFIPTTLGTPTILDQLDTSACFGFAAVQGIHIATGKPIGSPLVPYWCARREATQADTDVADEGTDPDSMIAALNDFGAAPMADDPFDAARINERPGDVAMLAAQQTRCTVEPLLATGAELWTAIQHAICVERLPVLLALNVVPSFDRPEIRTVNGKQYAVVDDPSGDSRGGHAQCGFGTCADVEGLLDAGSWGTSDGIDGIKVLTPRFIGSQVMWAAALRITP